MTIIETKDFIGYSKLSIDDAISEALKKVGNHPLLVVVETRSSQQGNNQCQYHATLTIREE